MRRIESINAITFFAFSLCSLPLRAEEGDRADAEEIDWPEVEGEDSLYQTEVHGYRLMRTDEATGHAETIGVGEKHKSSATVAEVVSDATGVEVRSMGGPGSFGAASIRGSTSGQVPVFLDGVQLNLGAFSSVNLGDFSLAILDSIEVWRGNTPLVLGMGGIGGAIVLRTRDFGEPITEVNASYGSWNTWRLSALRQDSLGPLSALVLFTAGGSDGDFEYYNTNGTFHNSDDDEMVRRANNHHTSYNTLVKLNLDKGKWKGQLTDELFFIQQGVAGIDSFVGISSSELRRMRNALSLRATRPLGARGDATFEIQSLLMKQAFRDPEGTVGLGHGSTVFESAGLGGVGLFEAELNPCHRLGTRAAVHYEIYKQTTPGLPAEDQASPVYRVKPQLGLEYEWNVFQRFFVEPVVRAEMHYSHFDGAPLPEMMGDFEPTTVTEFYLSPSLGLRYLVSDTVTLRANAGRYVRTPEMTELFGDHGNMIGNPGLREETAYNVDLGVTAIVTGKRWVDLFRLDVVGFAGLVNDLISLEKNSQSTIRPVNIEEARVVGAELAVRIHAFDHFGLSGNYTLFHGVNRSNIAIYEGKQLPGRAPHQVYARFEVNNEFQQLAFTAFYDFEFSSRTYTGQYNDEFFIAMHLFHGVGGRVEHVPLGLSFTLEIHNLTDNRVFHNADGNPLPMSDYLHYPLPGRGVFGTLHWTIPN